MRAAGDGKLDIVECLVSSGAVIDHNSQASPRRIHLTLHTSRAPSLTSSIGQVVTTPLLESVNEGQLAVMEYLLAHGADVNKAKIVRLVHSYLVPHIARGA